MRFVYAVTALLFVFTRSEGQVVISPQYITEGLLQKEQFWNVLIMQNNSTAETATLQFTVTNMKTGNRACSGRGTVLLTGKAQQLQLSSYTNVQYMVSYSEGFLPIGKYNITYILYTGQKQIPSGEQTYVLRSTPLSPPILILPSNEDSLATVNPLFSWSTPAPVQLFKQLSYVFKLVEVEENQKKENAVRNNTVLYEARAAENFLMYSPALPALLPGKKYAWQIYAYDESEKAAQSDVASFTIRKNNIQTVLDFSSFPALQKNPTVVFYSYGIIRFAYRNNSNSASINVDIREQVSGNQVYTRSVKTVAGDNYIELEIPDRKFVSGTTYSLYAGDDKQSILFTFLSKQ